MNPKTFQQTRLPRQPNNNNNNNNEDQKKNGDRALSTKVPQLQINYSQQSSINLNDIDNNSQQQINNRILNYQQEEQISQSHKFENQNKNQRNSNFKRDRVQTQTKNKNNRQEQKYLILKNDQLQKMCIVLSQTNKKLLNRIHFLQQSQPNTPFIDEFSQMQSQFSEVQNLIHQYRGHLDGYQQKLQQDLISKDQLIDSLKDQITNLVQTNATISQQSIQLEKLNQNLIRQNQELQVQIENLKEYQQLQRQRLRKSMTNYSRDNFNMNMNVNSHYNYNHNHNHNNNPQAFSSRDYRDQRLISQPRNYTKRSQIQYNNNYPQRPQNSRYYQNQNNDFEQQSQYSRLTPVQKINIHSNNLKAQQMARQQMEILIQRLVNQLQYQKKIKNKMNQQIKRLNKQLLVYQKDIMDKSNKIYCLELNALKNGKTLRVSKSTTQLDHRDKNRQSAYISSIASHNNYNGINKQSGSNREMERHHSQSSLSHSFPLINLLNRQIEISDAAKIQIARKIVALYEKKLQHFEYSQIMIQQIEVLNFNQNNLDILLVRQTGNKNKIDKNTFLQFKSNNKQSQKQAQNLIYNMALCLDNLFNQVPNSQDQLMIAMKKDFLQMLQNMLSKIGVKNSSYMSSFSQLSLFLQKALVTILRSYKR